MRPRFILLLVAACQRGNAGPRRRDLDWDMFGSGDLGMDSGSIIPTMDDYGSGSSNPEGSSDYPFTLDETGTDISSGDWNLDSATLENPDTASLTDPNLFSSNYVSDSGCSSDSMVSGKARRDGGMCLDTNGVTKTKPKLPKLGPNLPGFGPDKDPDWLRIFPKPDPETPNQIPDPRFDRPPEEPEEIIPSTMVQGPCPWRFKYLCCELWGQDPPILSFTPIENCVRCM